MATKGMVDYCYHVVFYCDVLGQRELLRHLTELPRTREEKEKTLSILRDTAGFLIALRGFFAQYFEAFQKEPQFVATLPDALQRAVRQTRAPAAKFRYFSDSFVVWSSTLDDPENEGARAIGAALSTLVAACGTQLVAFAGNHAMRGGIDIGLGIELRDDGDLYGPALERAVYLESKKALSPRIVVGSELLEFVRASESVPVQTPFGQLTHILAGICRQMLFVDSDGVPALDFLGAHFRRFCGGLDVSTFIPRAYQFVAAERVKWNDAGDAKLAPRYDALWSYFCSRADIWGVDPHKYPHSVDAK